MYTKAYYLQVSRSPIIKQSLIELHSYDSAKDSKEFNLIDYFKAVGSDVSRTGIQFSQELLNLVGSLNDPIDYKRLDEDISYKGPNDSKDYGISLPIRRINSTFDESKNIECFFGLSSDHLYGENSTYGDLKKLGNIKYLDDESIVTSENGHSFYNQVAEFYQYRDSATLYLYEKYLRSIENLDGFRKSLDCVSNDLLVKRLLNIPDIVFFEIDHAESQEAKFYNIVDFLIEFFPKNELGFSPDYMQLFFGEMYEAVCITRD